MQIKRVDTLPPIEAKCIGFDIETTRRYRFKKHKNELSDPYQDRIIALSISDGETAWVLEDNLQSAVPLLTNPEVKKCAHNASFDMAFLQHQLGITIENVHDTLMAERLLYAGQSLMHHGLDDVLARRYGVMADKSIRAQFENHHGKMTDEQIHYSAMDSFYLRKMRDDQMSDIAKAGMGRVMAVENQIVPIVARMWLNGVGFDGDLWQKYLVDIHEQTEAVKSHVAKFLDMPSIVPLFGGMALGIDLGSTVQVTKHLENKYGLVVESTGEDELHEILDNDPENPACDFIKALLEYRKWSKRSEWEYDRFVHPITGRIHAQWKPLEAKTGRVACELPNLMQTPRWTGKEGEPNFRLLFPPGDAGYVYVIADYSQQEPRIFAEISGDEAMRAACNSKDVYIEFAKSIFPDREIDKELRYLAKTLTLATLYGAQPKKLAVTAGISLSEAEDLHRRIRQSYPRAAQWADGQLKVILQRGYTTTLLGRRQYFLDVRDTPTDKRWKYANMARNSPNQGSGADMFKMAAAKIVRCIEQNGYDAYPALFVHDEVVLKVREDIAQEVYYQLIGAMEEAGHELCPHVETVAEGNINERWSK